MILVIASILGYMTENIWVGLRFGYWDNRGMMMPGLLGYGMAIVGLYLILGLPQKPILFGHEFFFENSLHKRVQEAKKLLCRALCSTMWQQGCLYP